jgi:NAD(P)-dependent dehydrogenase (short-subunit alcohol dehydrogenase family)
VKTALISGTSSGFGRALVPTLLARGFRVIATLRRADERRDIFAEEAQKYGDRLVVLSLDVTRDDERAAVARAVGDTLDCLVNNAGYALFGALEDATEDQLRAQIDVNLVGAMLLTRALLPALRAARGTIINVSSVFGYSAFPLTSAYCASKYGLEGFSEALYHELAPHGVRVHLVEPGGHKTGFASNVEWSKGSSATYAEETRGYRAFKTKLEKKPGAPAERVVQKIALLAERPSKTLRVRVGADARAMALFNLAPQALSLPAWTHAARRMLTGGSGGGA